MYMDSPLRYPGGKARLGNFVKYLVVVNKLQDGHYVEPFTGGGSVALALLFGDFVRHIHLNDIDPAIYAFWRGVLERTDEFCARVSEVTLTVEEWRRQRAVYLSEDSESFDRGFAAFYLNRTNRSGIIGNAGVIGGLEQSGPWKLDARFPRDELVRRIRRIGEYRSRIHLTGLDAIDLLSQLTPTLPARSLVYLDPPYFVKGQGLYANPYRPGDHAVLAAAVRKLAHPWIVSYDDHPELHRLYDGEASSRYALGYSAHRCRVGSEVMFFSPGLKVPDSAALPTGVTARAVDRLLTSAPAVMPLFPAAVAQRA